MDHFRAFDFQSGIARISDSIQTLTISGQEEPGGFVELLDGRDIRSMKALR